jgi:hypothetical protein
MEHNYHSTNNQRVLGKLVDREVIANQSYLVTELLKHHYDEAEWTNVYVDNSEEMEELTEIKDKYESAIYSIEEKIEEYAEKLEEAIENNNFSVQEKYKNKIDILTSGKSTVEERILDTNEQIEELEREQEEPKEPLEWWLVTGWFEEKLKGYGEVFVEIFGETWWGRTCTGQAILLDYVIGRIGEDMEILEGQDNHKFWRD